MKQYTLLAAVAVCVLGCVGIGFAARQSGAVTVDGTISEITDSSPDVQTVPSAFGAGVGELFNLRISNDSTYLYVGVASKLDGVNGTRGVWIMVDSKSGGQNTLATTGIGTAPQGAKDLTGTVLNSGFDADYILFMQNGNSGSRNSYYLNVLDLQASSETYYGVFDVTANTFTASGFQPSGFAAAVDNTESASNPSGAATATKGLEFQIPLSAIGTTDSGANTVRVLVGTGDGGNGYWGNQTLPANSCAGSLGGGNSNGSSPNFQTKTAGAFAGNTSAWAGTQMRSMSLPVTMSGFAAE